MAKLANITRTEESFDHVIDSYLLRHTRKVRASFPHSHHRATVDQVVVLFADYGLFMTPKLLARVTEMTAQQRGGFFAATGKTLHAAFGTHFKTSPMYRAFPNHQDVMIDKGMVDFLLTFGVTDLDTTSPRTHGANPVTGEQTDVLGPDADADDRFSTPLVWGRRPFQPVGLGFMENVIGLANSVLGTLSPLSPDDSLFIAACVDEGYLHEGDLSTVKFREKLPALVGLVSAEVYDASAISVTDALRLAAHFSNDDVSLTRAVKFRLPKAAGKRVLRLAERVILSGKGTPEDDVIRHEESWKRLIRHVGTERARKVAPLLSVLVDEVRTGKVRSWNSRVQNASAEDAARLLAQRPGAFVRSAVALSRRFDAEEADRSALLETARSAFAAAPAPALLQLRTVLARTVHETDRFHVMKTGKVLHSERAPEAHNDLLGVLEDVLHARLAGLLPWSGAENSENRFVPVGGRTASASSDGSVRGDSVKIEDPDAKTVRMFLHWKHASDVDLSAVLIGADGDILGSCSYMDLSVYAGSNRPVATHSGDIRDGRKGAAEYVDVDIERAKAAGVKMIMLVVNVYSGAPFCDFPTHVGVMTRDGHSGKHFEAAEVQTSMRVSSASTTCTCAAFDLNEMRLTYLDMPTNWRQRTNVRSGERTLSEQTRLMMNYGAYRVSLADVLKFAGTPGGPVLTDRELVEKRGDILASLADAPAGTTPRAEDDDLSV